MKGDDFYDYGLPTSLTMIEFFSHKLPICKTIRTLRPGAGILFDPAFDTADVEDVTALAIRKTTLPGFIHLTFDTPQSQWGLTDRTGFVDVLSELPDTNRHPLF